jgi:hypothetical protein
MKKVTLVGGLFDGTKLAVPGWLGAVALPDGGKFIGTCTWAIRLCNNGTDPLLAGLLSVERLNLLARRCGNAYNRDGSQLLGVPAMSSAASVAHRGG